MHKRIFFLGLIFISIFTTPSCAQDASLESHFINQRSRGGFITFGIPYNTLPEGNKYNPLLFGGSFYFPFFQTKKIFNIGVDLVPNAAIVFVGGLEFEFGFNVGVLFNFALSPNDVLRFRIGAGPHIITIETKRQAKGFAFSDNFFAEYLKAFKLKEKDYFFGIDVGLRHISNAGLNRPNVGIDDIMFGLRLVRVVE